MTSISYLNLSLWISSSIFKNFRLLKQFDVSISLELFENFNKENCIRTLRLMSGNQELNEMPHYDTLNYYLEKLSPECLSELRKKMVVSLIRGKQFNRNRLLGKYWRVILDGTGLSYFKEKHCDNCLCTEKQIE